MKRTLALTAAAVATTLPLAACGGNDDTAMPGMSGDSASSSSSESASAASGEFTGADVMFAQGMIPHHAQAVEMSDVLLAKDDVDEDVRALAEQIKAAQAPEIEQMTGWLEGWDAEVPSMDGMDMGTDDSMNEMMSPEDMQALEDATGTEASRLFIEQMTEHHDGAIEMAQTELDEGTDPEAKELAQTIIDTQQAEIEEMQELLAGL